MKNALLGVTGGIAAYKACDLVSELREREIQTRVVMTSAATRFVQPLTFSALTGHAVLVDDLNDSSGPAIPHVEWARWAHVAVIAPATADFLGRLAQGLAGDTLGSLMLALEASKRVVLAPAMNSVMWENELVQGNLERLRGVGDGHRFFIVEPVEKRLACGDHGMGGLASVERIADAVLSVL